MLTWSLNHRLSFLRITGSFSPPTRRTRRTGLAALHLFAGLVLVDDVSQLRHELDVCQTRLG